MEFCNPFDQSLAESGTPAVFLFDDDGMLRFDETWTRDAWGRQPGPHAHGWVWRLLRDHTTGFVTQVLTTSPTLLTEHPRADVRAFDTAEAAAEARAAFGHPPVTDTPW